MMELAEVRVKWAARRLKDTCPKQFGDWSASEKQFAARLGGVTIHLLDSRRPIPAAAKARQRIGQWSSEDKEKERTFRSKSPECSACDTACGTCARLCCFYYARARASAAPPAYMYWESRPMCGACEGMGIPSVGCNCGLVRAAPRCRCSLCRRRAKML